MRPKVFPKNPQEHYSESSTFEAFSRLSDDWTVLYSYRWHGMRKGRTGDGEADFLLIHPLHGFYIAEVKGGSDIKYEDGGFSQKSGGVWHKMTTGPFEQGVISKNEIARYLKKCIDNKSIPNLPNFVPEFGHFVVFPSAIEKSGFPPEGPREIIMDSDDLISVEKRLLEIVHHWNNNQYSKIRNLIRKENVEAIISALRPYKELVQPIQLDINRVKDELILLTNAQAQILNGIDNIAVVSGAAGTGKTTLALERAIDLAEQGLNTLFLCFNRPLSDHLNANSINKSGKLTISTLHSFAKKVCDMGQLSIDINDYSSLIENFPFAAMSQGISFDAVIVDEAQDFTPEMWQSLTEFIDAGTVTDGFVFNIFLDSNQNIYEGSGWESAIQKYTEHIKISELLINCRNTTEIGLLVEKFGGSHLILGAKGPDPKFIDCDRHNEIRNLLELELEHLKTTFGFSNEEITVLTSTRRLLTSLEIDFTSKNLIAGNQLVGIKFETIRSFKGLESPCVVVIFSPDGFDDAGEILEQSELDRLCYVGLSRAQIVLTVIGNKTEIQRCKSKSKLR